MILYSIFCKKIYKLSSTGPFSNLKKLVENIIIFLKNPVLQDSSSAAGRFRDISQFRRSAIIVFLKKI